MDKNLKKTDAFWHNWKIILSSITQKRNLLIELVNKKEVLNIFTASLNNEDIIEVSFHKNNNEIEKMHLELLKEAIGDLGKGKKMLVFINATDFLGITNEARAYAALEESNEFTLANAVLIKSLANKLLFNFFLKLNKPIIETKGFTSKETAFEWLLSLK